MNPNNPFSAALDSVAQMPSPESLEGLSVLSKLNPAEIEISQSARVGFLPHENTFVVVATHTPSGVKAEATGSNLIRVRSVALDRLAFAVQAELELAAKISDKIEAAIASSIAAEVAADQEKHARDLFVALHGHEPETPPVLDDVIAEAVFELRERRKPAIAGERFPFWPCPTPTGTEASVCLDIASRQALGRAKYGTTVEENPLPLADWIRHAYEEALDLAIYLKRAGEEIEKGKA